MAAVLKLKTRPMEIEARELTRETIESIGEWIYAERIQSFDDFEGLHVIYTVQNDYQMMLDEGDFMCKDEIQTVWNATKDDLLRNFDFI